MRKKIFALLFTVMVVIGFVAAKQSETVQTFNPFTVFGSYESERSDGGYYTIVDEKGKVLHQTAMGIFPGDEFIAQDNRRYKVSKVQGDMAYSEYVGTEKIAWDPAWDKYLGAATGAKEVQAANKQGGNRVGIYHTHSDESYVPTDGKSSEYGKGGIYKVGRSLGNSLLNQGIKVNHSYRTHDPHDTGAYHRSRRTAVELLKKRPLALIDVHRDAVPAQVYKTKIEGKPVTKVKLVVGRQNPHMSTNMAFAKKVKAYIDKTQPGLIEGIFIAKGNYNQDLSPRAMLIEVGSHTNSRYDAERGVSLFATAVPTVIGAETSPQNVRDDVQPPSNQPGEIRTERGSGGWRSIGWIIGIIFVGGAIFLLISTGSVKGSVDKLKHFSGTEFANFLGRKEVDPIKKDQEIKDSACPEGSCVEDVACPEGSCVEDVACPEGSCVESKEQK